MGVASELLVKGLKYTPEEETGLGHEYSRQTTRSQTFVALQKYQ